MDFIDELHHLYQARRPHSTSPYYAYRSSKALHIHFRTRGCRYARCICCDYGCSDEAITPSDIDTAIDQELTERGPRPGSLLIGSFGSLLDPHEFDDDLLCHLLHRVSSTGVKDVTIETSWQSINRESVQRALAMLPGATVTFECGLESANESIRSLCYGKDLHAQVIADAVETIHAAGGQACANIMLGAPFLDQSEQIKDALDSILWSLGKLEVDDVVLFPVNIRPYTALRALYDLALYEQTRLWQLIEVLEQLPDWALSRTHAAWWGERSTAYSLGNIAPIGCNDCTKPILDTLEAYTNTTHLDRASMSVRRREILTRLEGSNASNCGCRNVYHDCEVPSDDELRSRRLRACKRAMDGGDAKLVWISPRESDLNVASDMFVASSTVYGSNTKGNHSYSSQTGWRENHNDVTPQQIESMARDQIALARTDERVRFMAYNPYYTHGGNPLVVNRSICLNDAEVLRLFCDKRTFRRFAQRYVSVPDFIVERARDCTAALLDKRFPEGSVVQRGISSGGEGTYVVPSGTGLPDELNDPEEHLLVSRLSRENVPINVHAVIFERATVLFPGSTQLIEPRDGKLLYGGCDYTSFNDLSEGVRKTFYEQARSLCDAIARTGYRGILGLDAMVVDDRVLFLEMNSRFQASSHALNQALVDAGLPTLHQLHREAFLRAKPSVDAATLESVSVGYGTFAYSSHGTRELDLPIEHLLLKARQTGDVAVFDDGLDINQPRRPGAYLFGIMVRGRISSIHFDRLLNVDQNISCWGHPAPARIPLGEDEWMCLKIALLNQGCVISPNAWRSMESAGGVREGVNDAIDLEVCGRVVNVPIRALHQEFSPFELRLDADKRLELAVYDKALACVRVSYRDQVQDVLTPSGVPVSRICLLATDRVRVQHHDCCDVVERGRRCKFCNFPAGRGGFDERDIDFAVRSYLDSGIPFRHFLVGGGSDLAGDALERTLATVRAIRSRCDKPIYLMDMPPKRGSDLKRLKDAGVTEVAFNIEVFDRTIAHEVMPLKGAIPLSRYMSALEGAVALWGNAGAVRSALVVGIEPLASTLEGIKALASRGVAPILSVFRPVRFSDMEDSVGPDNTWLEELYETASAICSSYGLELGPECEACRNNVLAP